MPLLLVIAFLLGATGATAQAAADAAQAADADDGADAAPPTQEELDQMLAPIALYPDALLSQVLMASTYPQEIVEADRWARANRDVQGDALTTALNKHSWDASVKSLVNFPDLLSSLAEKLDWTTRIGNAFLADSAAVMTTVQELRKRALDAGSLRSSKELTVRTEPATEENGDVILIEQPKPEVIYVPTYDPAVAYGPWWYEAYPPPTYYEPSDYYPGAGWGYSAFACGVAWGWAWGGCDWDDADIDIDIDRNVNRDPNIDRRAAKARFERAGLGQGGKGAWKHDPAHRGNVAYRDRATAQRFGGVSKAQAQRSRDAFRGRAPTGRASPARPAPGRQPPALAGGGGRARAAAPALRARAGALPPAARARPVPAVPPQIQHRGGAFSGAGRGQAAAHARSRGMASRGRAVRGGGGRRR